MSPHAVLVAYSVSNLVAVGLVLTAWRVPNLARLLYAAMFAAAFCINLSTAIATPQFYADYYAGVASLDVYRHFIEGTFATHARWFIVPIAVGQLALAVLVVLRSGWVRLGLVGAISFFVAIAPLGIGSAFPCSLVMAMGAILLLRRPFEHILPIELRRAWTQLRHQESVQ
jgi:hypothetical protein